LLAAPVTGVLAAPNLGAVTVESDLTVSRAESALGVA
jgi:hypothetical protein